MVSLLSVSAAENAPTTDASWRLQVSIDPLMLSLISMTEFVVISSVETMLVVLTVGTVWLERVRCDAGIQILIEFGSSLVSGIVFALALLPCSPSSHISPGTLPSVSFRSTRLVGRNLTSMNACSRLARWELYAEVGKFPLIRFLMASR